MTNELDSAEYEALRATIRERGTARMWVVLIGLAAWGALALAVVAADLERAVTLVPLLMLAATFEISLFIHTGVERVGRYLQVYYEDLPTGAGSAGGSGWETTIMAYGRNFPGGLDPLFSKLFALAAIVNLLTTLFTAAGHPGWAGLSFVAHAVLAWRLVTARRDSALQRATDLERFRTLKNASASK